MKVSFSYVFKLATKAMHFGLLLSGLALLFYIKCHNKQYFYNLLICYNLIDDVINYVVLIFFFLFFHLFQLFHLFHFFLQFNTKNVYTHEEIDGIKKNQQVLLHGLCKVDLIFFFFFIIQIQFMLERFCQYLLLQG